jgi:hypothetical protein
MAGVEEVEVVSAHHDCATLPVGDVYLKIDADQARTDVEVEAMAMAPVPTPEVLWRKPPVLALAALPGTALGRIAPIGLGFPSENSKIRVTTATAPSGPDGAGMGPPRVTRMDARWLPWLLGCHTFWM